MTREEFDAIVWKNGMKVQGGSFGRKINAKIVGVSFAKRSVQYDTRNFSGWLELYQIVKIIEPKPKENALQRKLVQYINERNAQHRKEMGEA